MATPSTSELQANLEALLNGPAGVPPAGMLPDFDKPPSLNTVFYFTIAICITFSSLAVLIRIYTRGFLLRSMGYDDYASVISWLCLLGYLIVGLLVTKAGLGVHMWDLQLKEFFGLLHWINIVTIIYNPTAFLAKFSILLQYSRILNPTGRGNLSLFVAIRIGILSIFIFYFARLFFDIFQCNPREKIWNQLIITGHCYNGNAAYEASGVFNVISDFAILIMPMPSVWKLNMSLRKKLLTTGVFASGFFACLTSIMRTYYTWRVVESSDKSYMLGPFGLWSSAELSASVITSCLPAMPKFFQHIGPKVYKVFSLQSNSSSSSNHDQSDRSKTSKNNALTKIKSSFAKHSAGLNISESDSDPYSQLHSEYYMLNEFETSQPQAIMTCAPAEAPGVGFATRRNDLEYGHQGA